MSMYRCSWCDEYVDDDYHPGEDVAGEESLVCPDCFSQMECVHCGEGFNEASDVDLFAGALKIHKWCKSYHSKELLG